MYSIMLMRLQEFATVVVVGRPVILFHFILAQTGKILAQYIILVHEFYCILFYCKRATGFTDVSILKIKLQLCRYVVNCCGSAAQHSYNGTH